MPPDVRLLFAPGPTYAALARTPDAVTPLTALRRPLLAAVVLGVSVSIAATGRVSPALVASTTIMWSYVVVAQVIIALALIVTASPRVMPVPRALDLFFAAHVPWSLMALLAAVWAPTPLARPAWVLEIVALGPLLLTPILITAFFREVLGFPARAARRRTLVHQSLTWGFCVALFWLHSGLSPRVLQLLGLS